LLGVINMMTKATIGLLLSLPISGVLAAGLWAHDVRYFQINDLKTFSQEEETKNDVRYVRISELQKVLENDRKDELENRIDELSLKQNLGMTSPYEDALLEQLKERLAR
jgi:hypothetical protein